MENPERSPVPFDELSSGAQIAVANSITRLRYRVGTEPDAGQSPVSYQGSVFEVLVSHADSWNELERGPRNDPTWKDPVRFDARPEDGELTIMATNMLDDSLELRHHGRPYFGVLTAVSDTPSLLKHDQYDHNPAIHSGDIVRMETGLETGMDTTSIASGGTLQTSYRLPDTLPDESTIWLPVLFEQQSMDMFGESQPYVTTTIKVET